MKYLYFFVALVFVAMCIDTNAQNEIVSIGDSIDNSRQFDNNTQPIILLDSIATKVDSGLFVPKTEDIATLQKKNYNKKLFIPDPNKAMWYGLLCPGAGQIYNRRYWKLPIVYGGFAALIYGVSWNGSQYSQFRQYYSDMVDSNPDTKSYERLREKYGEITQERLKSGMDAYRRSRDLCIIGMVAFYAVTVLDAFVDASLSDFDISPDLSLKIMPTVVAQPSNPYNLSMRFDLNF